MEPSAANNLIEEHCHDAAWYQHENKACNALAVAAYIEAYEDGEYDCRKGHGEKR